MGGSPEGPIHPVGTHRSRALDRRKSIQHCLQSTFIHNQEITYHTITQAHTAQSQAPSPLACHRTTRGETHLGGCAPSIPWDAPSPSHGMLPSPSQGCSVSIPLGAQPRTQPEEPVCDAGASPCPPTPCPAIPIPPHPIPAPTLCPPSGAGVSSLYSVAVRSRCCGAGWAQAAPTLGDNDKVLVSEGPRAEHLRSGGKRRIHHSPAPGRARPWHPGASGQLLADADPLGDAALLARHEAAPVELAVAALAAGLPQDVVPAAAAQALAVVHARAGLVAQAPLGAQRVQRWLPLAEVGRLLKVDQLADAGAAAMPCVARLQLPCIAVVGPDESGPIEPVLEEGPHQAEFGCHLPAGLQLAAPRGAVALALPPHVVHHHLRGGGEDRVVRGEDVPSGGWRKQHRAPWGWVMWEYHVMPRAEFQAEARDAHGPGL